MFCCVLCDKIFCCAQVCTAQWNSIIPPPPKKKKTGKQRKLDDKVEGADRETCALPLIYTCFKRKNFQMCYLLGKFQKYSPHLTDADTLFFFFMPYKNYW